MEAVTAIYESLRDADSLPSPKGVALEILRALEDDSLSMRELARIVEKDPAITSRILRTANAAATGGARRIATVKDAAALLGSQTVQAIALAFSILEDNRKGQAPAFDYDAFWSESLARGAAMRCFAKHGKTIAREEAFTYGLLSLIGRLALASLSDERYAEVTRNARVGLADTDVLTSAEFDPAEFAVFGITGEQLSSLMTRDWGLPRHFDAVRCILLGIDDDDPSREVKEMLRLLALGRTTARICVRGEATPQDIEELRVAGSAFGISPPSLERDFAEAVSEWRTGGRELGITTRPVPDLLFAIAN